MGGKMNLPTIEQVNRPSVADQVFNTLQERILSLELPPDAKLSEVEVSVQLGVSRQPVRDAFYRLSKLGFLVIRPQRSTTVSLISEDAVMQARFVRTALEIETLRSATEALNSEDFEALEVILAAQKVAHLAKDPVLFHKLDDQFHREICIRAGVGFTWDLIQDSKAHMDRVRMLSLSFASLVAYEDHVAIFEAMKARDADAAAAAMRLHLGRIRQQIDRIREENHEWFESNNTL